MFCIALFSIVSLIHLPNDFQVYNQSRAKFSTNIMFNIPLRKLHVCISHTHTFSILSNIFIFKAIFSRRLRMQNKKKSFFFFHSFIVFKWRKFCRQVQRSLRDSNEANILTDTIHDFNSFHRAQCIVMRAIVVIHHLSCRRWEKQRFFPQIFTHRMSAEVQSSFFSRLLYVDSCFMASSFGRVSGPIFLPVFRSDFFLYIISYFMTIYAILLINVEICWSKPHEFGGCLAGRIIRFCNISLFRILKMLNNRKHGKKSELKKTANLNFDCNVNETHFFSFCGFFRFSIRLH